MAETNPTPSSGERSSSSSATAPRKKSLGRRIGIIAGAVVLALVLLVLLLPTLLSTSVGRGIVQSQINKSIAGKVQIDGLSLAWFGGQRLTGVTLLDPEGKTVANIGQIDVPDASLLSLATGSKNIGAVRIIKPVAIVEKYADGTMNLTRAIASTAAKEPKQPSPKGEEGGIPADLKVKLTVENGDVTYSDASIGDPVQLPDVNLTAAVDTPQRITVDLKSPVKRGSATGLLAANVAVNDLYDAKGQMQAEKAAIKGDATAEHVPVGAVDSMLNQGGTLLAVLGDDLNAKVNADGNGEQMNAKIEADSPNLHAKADVVRHGNGRVEMQKDSTIRLKITPQAFAALTAKPGEKPLATLEKEFEVTLTINSLNLPQKAEGGIDLAQAAVDAKATLTDIVLNTPDVRPNIVALRNTSASLRSDGLAKQLTATLDAVPEWGGQAGTMHLKADVNNVLTPEGEVNRTGMGAKVDGTIKGLPVALVDSLANQGGVALAALGPMLDATINADIQPGKGGQDAAGTLTLTATSQNLAATIDGSVAKNQFTSSDKSDVTLTVTQELFDKLTAPKVAPPENAPAPGNVAAREQPRPKLLQPTKVHIAINKLTTPLKGAGAATAVANAVVTLEDLLIDTAKPNVGQVALRETRITLDHNGPANTLDAVVHTIADQNGKTGTVDLTAKAEQFLSADPNTANPKFKVAIDGTIAGLPVAVADQIAGQDGLVLAMMGPTLDSKINGTITRTADNSNYTGDLNLTAKSQNLDANVTGKMQGDRFVLNDGGVIKLTVESALVEKLTAPKAPAAAGEPPAQPMALAQPAKVTITIHHFSTPQDAARKAETELALTATVDQLVPKGDPKLAGAALRDLTIDVPQTTLNKPLTVTAKGTLVQDKLSGKLDASATIADPLGAHTLTKADATITSLPVALVDSLGKQNGLLVAVLGDALDLVELHATPEQGGAAGAISFTAKVQSPNLNTDNFAGRYIPGDKLVLNDKGILDFVLTQRGLDAYRAQSAKKDAAAAPDAKPPMTLAAPAKLRLALTRENEIGLPPAPAPNAPPPAPNAPPAPAFRPAATVLGLRLTAAAITLADATTGRNVQVANLDTTINSDNLAKLLTIIAKADTQVAVATADKPLTGGLTSNTTITNLANAKGEIDTANAVIQTNTQAQHMPVQLLDDLAAQGGGLVDLLGQEVSMSMVGAYQKDKPSNWDVSLDGTNANAKIAATLTNDVATLREDATASFRVTPELAKRYLSSLNPLLNEAKSGDQPVKLTIAKDGFSAPVKDFEMSRLEANGQLDIGTLLMTPKNLLSLVLGSKELPAQFTTLKFTSHSGVIESNDLWLTAQRLSLGLQARVYSGTAKTGSDMTADIVMGIPASTLAFVPGGAALTKNVTGDPVFAVITKGPIGSVKPDIIGILTKNLGAIASTVGGKYGGIVGTVGGALDQLGGKSSKDGQGAGWVESDWPNRPKSATATQPGSATGQTNAVNQQPGQSGAGGAAGAGAGGAAAGIGGLINDALGGGDDSKASSTETPEQAAARRERKAQKEADEKAQKTAKQKAKQDAVQSQATQPDDATDQPKKKKKKN